MSISVSLFLVHVAVLRKIELTDSKALEYAEVLEQERKLLELQSSKKLLIFLIIVVIVLVLSVIVGLARTRATVSAFLPCLSLAAALAVHLMDFRTSLSGIQMWRSPQLQASECTAMSSMGLSSLKSVEGIQLTLSKSRNARLHLVRLLTWLLATAALSLLAFIVLDGMQMRGELVDYSFGRGYLTTPPHALARQNSLLLHSNVDSLPFTFAAGPYTSEVKLLLEHPYEKLDSDAGKPVPLPKAGEAEHGGGEYVVSLPSGPLYSRLTIQAFSHLYEEPTRYVFHIIRIGEAWC